MTMSSISIRFIHERALRCSGPFPAITRRKEMGTRQKNHRLHRLPAAEGSVHLTQGNTAQTHTHTPRIWEAHVASAFIRIRLRRRDGRRSNASCQDPILFILARLELQISKRVWDIDLTCDLPVKWLLEMKGPTFCNLSCAFSQL